MSWDRIDKKLDDILETQTTTQVTMASMKTDLAHHIKRSDQHEDHLKSQDKKINKIWYILIAGAAAGASEYSGTILKWLGLIL